MSRDRIPIKLQQLAQAHGYCVEFRGLVHRRGWPEKSAKPFALYLDRGGHLASFATVEALERNLRARAGC